MVCVFCSSSTKIYNSRSTHQKSQTWRRHRCTNCSRVFTTRERVDWDGVTSVKTAEGIEPYNRERLLLSLIRAGNNLDLPSGALTSLCDSIELHLQKANFFSSETQDSNTLATVAIEVLQRFDTNIALQYINSTYKNQPPIELLKQLLKP